MRQLNGIYTQYFNWQYNWILDQFSADRLKAIEVYIDFVKEGVSLSPIWAALKQCIFTAASCFLL